MIGRQTDQLTRLVNDLLDVTRISRGKIELQRTRTDLSRVVRGVCVDHRGTFEQAEVGLHFDLPGGPVWVDGDPARLSQVVANLLQNAAKFTLAGGAVSVELANAAGRAVLRVRDDGLGMEPKQIERMFEPFVQAERGLTRTRGGLGLGLPLARALVELHGGALRARSAGLGAGSEFTIELPLAEERPPPGPEPAAPASVSGRVVVVIEDSPDGAASLAQLLELSGHRVHVALNGRSGIELAREICPDLILCDIGLPDLDGFEVARALRAEECLATTRLVALSGYAQPEDRQRALEAGFDLHLAKPPALDALERVLALGPRS